MDFWPINFTISVLLMQAVDWPQAAHALLNVCISQGTVARVFAPLQ